MIIDMTWQDWISIISFAITILTFFILIFFTLLPKLLKKIFIHYDDDKTTFSSYFPNQGQFHFSFDIKNKHDFKIEVRKITLIINKEKNHIHFYSFSIDPHSNKELETTFDIDPEIKQQILLAKKTYFIFEFSTGKVIKVKCPVESLTIHLKQ